MFVRLPFVPSIQEFSVGKKILSGCISASDYPFPDQEQDRYAQNEPRFPVISESPQSDPHLPKKGFSGFSISFTNAFCAPISGACDRLDGHIGPETGMRCLWASENQVRIEIEFAKKQDLDTYLSVIRIFQILLMRMLKSCNKTRPGTCVVSPLFSIMSCRFLVW